MYECAHDNILRRNSMFAYFVVLLVSSFFTNSSELLVPHKWYRWRIIRKKFQNATIFSSGHFQGLDIEYYRDCSATDLPPSRWTNLWLHNSKIILNFLNVQIEQLCAMCEKIIITSHHCVILISSTSPMFHFLSQCRIIHFLFSEIHQPLGPSYWLMRFISLKSKAIIYSLANEKLKKTWALKCGRAWG